MLVPKKIDLENVEMKHTDVDVDGKISREYEITEKGFFKNHMPDDYTIEEYQKAFSYQQQMNNAMLEAGAKLGGKVMKENDDIDIVTVVTDWGGIGKQTTYAKRAVTGRNPSTGEETTSPSMTSVIKSSKMKATAKGKKDAKAILIDYLS